MNKLKQAWIRFWREEDGVGVLELILIIAVIVVIAIIFRKWIIDWVNRLLESISEKTDPADLLNTE